ncbi:hypothetical protein, partial [Treponema socranskii]|uniref:hypothetical protein n=1 Tax=Treponema socranskii TaxID=53419 RepID=UPI003D8E2DB3
ELKNGNRIHSYKINNENEIIEEYFYTDNEIDIVNTVKYEYENKRLSKKKSFVSEYNYFYNKNGDLIEIVDNQNNRKVFKYKKKNNRIIQERLIQKQGETEDIQYIKNIFYNNKGQVIREEINEKIDRITSSEFFNNQNCIKIIIYDYL